jgi:F-type H+-transporting ATPase subunit a
VPNLRQAGEGFTPPSTSDFNLPSFFNDNPYFTKPIAELFLAVILISVFFIIASRKAAVVPGKLQFAGESVYAFVRNSIYSLRTILVHFVHFYLGK